MRIKRSLTHNNPLFPSEVSNAPGIKTIIFDLGMVLLDVDYRIAARRIAAFADKNADQIFSLFFNSDVTMSFEAGRISPLEFFSRVKQMLNLRINYAEFIPIWQEIFFFSENNRKVYNLALKLKKDYKVVLLSNINVLHFEYIQSNFPVFGAFHTVITSFELGHIKPNPLVYEQTLEILASLPSQTFYTDDRLELVKSARDLGIKSFLFRDPEQLKRDLLISGVKC